MAIPTIEINALDVVHPDVLNIEKNLLDKGNQLIMKFGGMSNGVGQMVTNVTRLAKLGEVRVLRLWSHGFPGGQGVSQGYPDARISVRGQRVGISRSNFDDVAPELARLVPYFGVGGWMELRGCSVGAGDDGSGLLSMLATLVKVPVWAAIKSQPIGPIEWSGPVIKMLPNTREGQLMTGPSIK